MTKRVLVWCAVSTTAQAEDDKESLPTQEAQARALAERHGWHVLDVLRVPGHSRSYLDFWDMARDASAKGIDAFYRLIDHCERQDFDVLIARDGNRFAREQPPHSFMIHRVIRSGAVIHLLNGGQVDAGNVTGFVAIDGYATRNEIEQLTRRRDIGFTGRAKRGLNMGSHLPTSHILERDAHGKSVRLVVDPELRAYFDDAAMLILEGVRWMDIELELSRRYGYETRSAGLLYRLVNTPAFWGHTARYYTKGQRKYAHPWAYDERETVPEGVLVFRDTHEPVYTGVTAERIRAELQRRASAIKGRAVPHSTHAWTGLLVCDVCGYGMRYLANGRGHQGYYCDTKQRPYRPRACAGANYVSYAKLRTWLEPHLLAVLSGIPDAVFAEPVPADSASHLERLQADMAALETQARTLIKKQMAAPDTLHSLYDDELTALSERLDALRLAQRRLATQQAYSDTRQVELAVQQIRALKSVAAFWEQDERVINQQLHLLLTGRQIVVEAGVVKGVTRRD